MGDVIVIQFITLDGVVSDPTEWAFRYGPGPVSDDKFRLGSRMEVQLYGRRTWEQFAGLWPTRDSAYATTMNETPKRVATRTGIDASRWSNSEAIDGDPIAWITSEPRNVVVIGSTSLVRTLAAADLVDEYRLLTFPIVVGAGERLFTAPGEFRFTQSEHTDVTTLTVLRRDRT